MKLIEALGVVRQPLPHDADPFPTVLACGFSPLHLQTFLEAHLRRRLPSRTVKVLPGLYGDLAGTLENPPLDAGAAVVALEWSDLDARLGYRLLGDWSPETLSDIAETATLQLARVLAALRALAPRLPVAVSLPTLPFPPCSFHRPGEASGCELRIRAELASFAAAAADLSAAVVSPDVLSLNSAPGTRADVRSELASGFPYTISHADALADLLADAVAPPQPRKGLITDLDNTLWRGIVGDDGVEAVSWTLDGQSQLHGIYQQVLNSLAEAGVLVGIASKNDPSVARSALQRPDLVLRTDRVFPVEAHWEPKSGSVSRILQAWNIGPEDVVFVDDSPMELAEVQAVHPKIEGMIFPREDPAAIVDFLYDLRKRFGKRHVREEDRLRSESLRNNPMLALDADHREHLDLFLRRAEARIRYRYGSVPLDGRALELINKTNQFNLNGRRVSEGAWPSYLADPSVHLVTVDYEDRFGRLGKIAVVAGRVEETTFQVDHWVMSCRAFARRIEYHTLGELFEHFGCGAVALDYRETDRNAPFRSFLSSVGAETAPGSAVVSRTGFDAQCPSLYHEKEVS